jgi:hypothetical protein
MADGAKPRRTRVERGIYRQANGNLAVCARRAGRLHFRTAGTNLEAARRAREDLIALSNFSRNPLLDTRHDYLSHQKRDPGGSHSDCSRSKQLPASWQTSLLATSPPLSFLATDPGTP